MKERLTLIKDGWKSVRERESVSDCECFLSSPSFTLSLSLLSTFVYNTQNILRHFLPNKPSPPPISFRLLNEMSSRIVVSWIWNNPKVSHSYVASISLLSSYLITSLHNTLHKSNNLVELKDLLEPDLTQTLTKADIVRKLATARTLTLHYLIYILSIQLL